MLLVMVFIIMFTFCGCLDNHQIEKELSVKSQESGQNSSIEQEVNWYDKFNQKGDLYASNIGILAESGIDILSIVEKHCNTGGSFDDMWDIVSMNYSVVPCNFSKNNINYNDDVFLEITITKSWWKQNCIIYAIFVYDENEKYGAEEWERGKYKNVYEVRHRSPSYRLLDITGDIKQELIITYDDSGNGYTDTCIKMLNLSDLGVVNRIFEEKLHYNANSFNKDKTTKDGNEYFNVFYNNQCEFIASDEKGYDIKFKSLIFDDKAEYYISNAKPIAQGQAIYKYNGVKYVTDNYYDYNAVAQKLYDEKE